MDDPELARYLADVDPQAAGTVRTLHEAIMVAQPGLEVALKYRMLMYTLRHDWRHWICALDAHPRKAVGLRFLYGVLLADPRGALRPGTSTLMTWDFQREAPIDAAAVRAYVDEAVARHEQYRRDAKEISAAARASRPSGRRNEGAEGAGPGGETAG